MPETGHLRDEAPRRGHSTTVLTPPFDPADPLQAVREAGDHGHGGRAEAPSRGRMLKRSAPAGGG